MIDYTYLWDLFSLAMGLAAWILPIGSMLTRGTGRRAALCRELSLLCCGAALLGQILYAGVLVTEEDWSALLDTWDVVVWLACVLLIVTAALNLAARLQERKTRPQA